MKRARPIPSLTRSNPVGIGPELCLWARAMAESEDHGAISFYFKK